MRLELAKAQARIVELEKLVPVWIPVSERLPISKGGEFVWFQPEVSLSKHRNNALSERIAVDRYKPCCPRETTHWLENLPPFPQPPKGEANDN